MGWHCITVWECGLTPARRENTLEMLAAALQVLFTSHLPISLRAVLPFKGVNTLNLV